MRIKLSDADRERLGCPEWLSVRLSTMGLREAKALQASGVNPFSLADRLRGGVPVLDADGNPRLDKDGEPLRRLDLETWQVLVWLGLTRAGVEVDFDDFDFDVAGFDYAPDEDRAGADEGKAEPAEPAEPATSET